MAVPVPAAASSSALPGPPDKIIEQIFSYAGGSPPLEQRDAAYKEELATYTVSKHCKNPNKNAVFSQHFRCISAGLTLLSPTPLYATTPRRSASFLRACVCVCIGRHRAGAVAARLPWPGPGGASEAPGRYP